MMRAVINLNILQIQLNISDRCKMEVIISIDPIGLSSYKWIDQIIRKIAKIPSNELVIL